MGKPQVSTILTTYNRAKTYLPKAIRSVLRQSFKDFELIVVDDCSSDETPQMVHAWMKKDKRIKYIRLKENSGSDTKPKNQGILASQGKYIAYLDDDCEFRRDHLRVLYEFLEKHLQVDVVYGDRWVLDDTNPTSPGSKGYCRDFDGQFLILRNFIDTSEVMHRRETVFAVGGWNEKLPKFVDWNLWVRMYKAGFWFHHLPLIITDYHVHPATKSNRVKTQQYFHRKLGEWLFVPTFDPSGCYIWLPYLGENEKERNPKVAIFTLTYERLAYTQRMIETLMNSTRYPHDWFVVDNGSKDGTVEWLKQNKSPHIKVIYNSQNLGISKASNQALEAIGNNYDLIVKVDNDCEFLTKWWLEDFVDIWKRNHMVYLSPYVEGLIHNPGGAPRVGHAYIGEKEWNGDKVYYVEVTRHIGGICAFIDAKAYKDFRWADKFLHGNQDREASVDFTQKGYMPAYVPKHRILHMETTYGQQKRYPEYFERRKLEKMTRVKKV